MCLEQAYPIANKSIANISFSCQYTALPKFLDSKYCFIKISRKKCQSPKYIDERDNNVVHHINT